MQSEFFQRLGSEHALFRLFDFLPDYRVFLKDHQSRFVALNRTALERHQLQNDEELIGRTDEWRHPVKIAAAIRADDLQVMESGTPLVNRVESLFNDQAGKLEWGSTTKLPVADASGRCIGVIGFSVAVLAPEFVSGGADAILDKVVEHIRQNHHLPCRVHDLAAIADVSIRRLNERFRKIYGMTLASFLMQTRVMAAARSLVQTTLPLGEIAVNHGFTHQSAMNHCFKKVMGQTPAQVRNAGRIGGIMQQNGQ